MKDIHFSAVEQNKIFFQMGILYNDGIGVEKYEKQAVKWYRLAAEQGHVDD